MRKILALIFAASLSLLQAQTTKVNLTNQVQGTLPAQNGGRGDNTNGNPGQVLIGDGQGHFTPQDPIVSFNYVPLGGGNIPATTTFRTSAQRISTLQTTGTLYVTFVGITGSPSGCTLQLTNYDSFGNSISNGSPLTLSPSNGTVTFNLTPNNGFLTAAQFGATYTCSTYPSAGNVTLDFVPGTPVGTGGGGGGGQQQVQGFAANGSSTSGNPVWVCGTNGGKCTAFAVDSSGNATVVGAGTAGSPAGGVLSIQGVVGGQAVTVSGTVTVNGTVTTIGAAASSGLLSGDGNPVSVAGSDYTGTPHKWIFKVDSNGNIYTQTNITNATLAVTQSGTWNVGQSGSPWGMNLTQLNGAALGSPSNYGTSPGAVSVLGVNAFVTNTPSVAQSGSWNVGQVGGPWTQNITQWNSVALGSPSNYGTSPGAVSVFGVNAFITNVPSVAQSGTWNVGQSGAPWSQNLTQLNSVALGSPSNYGTSPGAVSVLGVNAFITNVPAVSQSGTWSFRAQDGSGNGLTTNSTTFTSKFALDSNLLGTLGTAFSTPGFVDIKGADGNVFVRNLTAANFLATVTQGNAGTNAQAWWARLGDATNGPVAVKPASTSAVIADPALTVTLSPNNLVPMVVQKTNAVSGSAVTTLNVAYGSNNTVGNSGIISIGLGNFAASNWAVAVTDTQGNTWSQDVIINQGTTLAATLFHAQNLKAGANTVTVTVSGTSSAAAGIAVELYEVSGPIIFDNAVDQTNTAASAASASLSNALPQLSNVNDFIVLVTAAGTGAGTITPSYVGSFVRNDSGTLTPTGGGVISFNSASAMNQDINPSVSFTSSLTSAAVVSVVGAYYPLQIGIQGSVVANLTQVASNPVATSGVGIQKVGIADGSGNNLTSTSGALDTNTKTIAGNAVATAASGIAKVGLTDGTGNAITSTSSALDTNTKTWLGSSAPTVGSKTSANSIPVVIASDQGAVTVAQATAANLNATVVQATAANLNATVVGSKSDNGAAAGANRVTVLPAIAETTPPAAATGGNDVALITDKNRSAIAALLPPNFPTFVAATTVTAAASPTDVCGLPGNATNTVLVTRAEITMTQTTAGIDTVTLLTRGTADTAGTSSNTNIGKLDRNNSAAVSVPLTYTANPTVNDASPTNIRQWQIGAMASGTTSPNDIAIYSVGNSWGQGITLRGTAQVLYVNFGGTAHSGLSVSCTFQWMELPNL